MFLDAAGRPSESERQRVLKIDGPAQPYADKKRAGTRLLAFDHDVDLSLIEIDNGPFFYIPVAPPGHTPGRNIHSLGYDNMAWPITRKTATILGSNGNWTYTQEKPWHGRSGGGLVDIDARRLIGVVHGYEVKANGRGIYISHAAILKFLDKHGKTAPAPPKASPSPQWHQRCKCHVRRAAECSPADWFNPNWYPWFTLSGGACTPRARRYRSEAKRKQS